MDKVVPREVVEVAISAGQQETSGDGVSILSRFITFRSAATFVNKAGSLRSVAVLLDLE
ncbi:hypothetical protein D3C72_2552900 [compost metagenome]